MHSEQLPQPQQQLLSANRRVSMNTRNHMLLLSYTLFLLIPEASVNAAEDNQRRHTYLRSRSNQPRRETRESRIVGGRPAELNSYPSYVQWGDGCAGVLVHDDLVLTANHCKNGGNRPVYVGGDGSSGSGQLVDVEAVYSHPSYNPDQAHIYDFAILKLPQKIENVPFARLNTNANYPVDEQKLTVVGHGLLSENGKLEETPEIYHHVTIPFIEDCSTYFGQVDPLSQFCVGLPEGGKDACHGDSGSGIMDENGLLVGLVSWGVGCAQPNKPGVYARVSAIDRWLAHMKCDVSDFPPEDCATVEVDITVDDYPEEIGFSLLDMSHADQQEAVLVPPGTITATPRETVKFSFSVPKGRDYSLKIQDTNHDGFSSEFGQGRVVARDGDLQYQCDADFRGEFTSIELPQVGVSSSQSQVLAARTPLPTNLGAGLSVYASPQAPRPLYAIQVILEYTSIDAQVTWKLYYQGLDGNLTLIHEDAPSSTNRSIDDYRRQKLQFHDLDAGLYHFHVNDSHGASQPGIAFGRVFEIDNENSSLKERLHQINGIALEEGASSGNFSLGP